MVLPNLRLVGSKAITTSRTAPPPKYFELFLGPRNPFSRGQLLLKDTAETWYNYIQKAFGDGSRTKDRNFIGVHKVISGRFQEKPMVRNFVALLTRTFVPIWPLSTSIPQYPRFVPFILHILKIRKLWCYFLEHFKIHWSLFLTQILTVFYCYQSSSRNLRCLLNHLLGYTFTKRSQLSFNSQLKHRIQSTFS